MQVFIGTKNDTSKIATDSDLRVTIGSNVAHQSIDTNVAELFRKVGTPPQIVLEFLLLCSAVYVIDKKVLRSTGKADVWTRDIHALLPVSKPTIWAPIKTELEEMLSFLTGDTWTITFRQEAVEFGGKYTKKLSGLDTVSLFSGGLDSAVGAIELIEAGKKALLLGHYDSPHTHSDQHDVWMRLRLHYADKAPRLAQVRMRPNPLSTSYLGTATERTTRSRSILFLGLGIAAAAALSESAALIIPENGFISINPPMDATRLGSCSTRTTHPFFLNRLQKILSAIGIANPISNPFQFSTKGEIVKNCASQAALKQIVSSTMSCAHPEAGRWKKHSYGACGYCYPCIIRRVSLNATGLDDPKQYLVDIAKKLPAGVSDTIISDVRAVLSIAGVDFADRQKNALRYVLTSGPIPDSAELPKLVAMYRRGLKEIRAFFTDGSGVKSLGI